MKNINTKKGFTIIEVVLVLAIAGLIFLMVFVALPSLQKSQRDTERKNNYNVITSAVTTYSSNHHGQLPTDDSLDPYIETSMSDPSTGAAYSVSGTTIAFAGAVSDAVPVVIIVGTDCDGNATGNRSFSLHGYLEQGEFCANS